MKLPRKLRLFGNNYVIKWDIANNTFDSRYRGRIDERTRVITLPRDLSDSHQATTLLHELLHGCFNHFANKRHDEEIVHKLEGSLWALMADNPAAFHAIIDVAAAK